MKYPSSPKVVTIPKVVKILISCILASLISWPSFSQRPPVKYGEIPMDDMTMTTYEKDSSAAAVILVDYLKTYAKLTRISSTSTKASSVFERQVRIKILKKDGLRQADVVIPFPVRGSGTDRSRITNLRATTYNIEGGKIVETEMSKEGVFKENLTGNLDLQKFTLPNIKVGSVLEYSYTVNSPLNFPDWEFQHKIPVRWCEYWAIIPEYFIVEKYMQGYVKPAVYEDKSKEMTGYSTKAYHWILKNVPAFKAEPYMTNERDYVSKVNFALPILH